MSSAEEDLTAALRNVFLTDHGDATVEGLDEDLVAYIAGMLAGQVAEEDHPDSTSLTEAIDEVMLPFLESVSCPEDLITKAQGAAVKVLTPATTTTNENKSTTTRKLRQGVVSMSSDLKGDDANDEQTSRLLWGTDSGVKAMANTLIDAHQDKSSARDKRKARKALAEKERKMLASSTDEDVDEGIGLVRMNFMPKDALNAATEKTKDVLVRNVTLSLSNGAVLIEQGPSELKFAHARRYGLIGENGIGKSTLLKAIASPDEEIPNFPTHLRVLHVRQEVPRHLPDDLTVTQAVLQSDLERMALLDKEKELLAKLEGADSSGGDNGTMSIEEKRKKLKQSAEAGGDDAEMAQLNKNLKSLDDVYARLQLLRSDTAQSRCATILTGLQFTPEMQHQPLSSLSGGWRMRVALAAALFVEPDILMLDEPTNHLDLEAVLWLESYLVTYRNTVIVVSHDRGFLNEVCTDIIEFKHKKLTYYRGNFDTYVKLRDENTRNAMRVYQAYQSKREHMMEFIEKFRANAKRATMVQSRIKAVEKMDAEAPEPVIVDQVWRFSIPNSEPISPPIIAVNDVSFDYTPVLPDGTKKPEKDFLLQKVNFGVDLTSKIAILGKNGQGKTTLLNLIMGKLRPIKGDVYVHGNLRIGHFTQHSADSFDLKLSAVENLLNMFDEAEDQEIRSFLGRFQIQGNDALKPMMLLSGGQKSRVAFAALAFRKPHVLVIDEGSNHLSMEAVDALVEAIQDFKGGILVVSHDEYFVSNTCNELWVVERQVNRFRGSFEEYKQHTAAETQKRVAESLKRLNAASNN